MSSERYNNRGRIYEYYTTSNEFSLLSYPFSILILFGHSKECNVYLFFKYITKQSYTPKQQQLRDRTISI